MVDVKTDILIRRPLGTVSSYARNPANAPEWYVNIKSAKRLDGQAGGMPDVGSQVAFTAHFLGRRLDYIYEIIESTEQKFVMRTAQGPFPMETIYEWERLDDDVTKMTLRNRGNPEGFSRLFSPIMAMMMKRANKKDLLKLKSILESPIATDGN